VRIGSGRDGSFSRNRLGPKTILATDWLSKDSYNAPIESSCLIGNWMPKNSVAMPAGPDEVEKEFIETLRQAAFIFEREKDGRFHGSILACKGVVRFIYCRGGGAELAGPFLQIAAAFEDLARGGKPRLFLKKSTPEKERERSPERKHIQMLAAAALEVMISSRRVAPELGTRIRRKGPTPPIGSRDT
jgi:hypothetical protein